MATSSRPQYITAMRFWWNATPMEALRLSTFQDALNFYDKSPTFVEQFGKASGTIEQSKVKAALESLAKKYGTLYPPKEEFFNAVAGGASSWTWTDSAAVAVETVKDVKNVALAGLGIYAVVGAGALAFFLLQKSGKAK